MGGVCFLVLVSLNATCQGHGALSCFMVLCRVFIFPLVFVLHIKNVDYLFLLHVLVI